MIFVMLDQAQCERDVNITHLLLQQAITPGLGYYCPHGMDILSNNDGSYGHWGIDKLRTYIATIHEKFHPTLTPEASELLEKHYSLCCQQGNGEVLLRCDFWSRLFACPRLTRD
jgi:DNA replicative helicase MCM subunit Mcm2 (Cdc46/Mcm family)